MLQVFRQPYPFSASWRTIFFEAVLAAVLVTGFIFIFRPFGTLAVPGYTWPFLRVCMYYGLVTLVVSLAWGGVMRAFPRYFNEASWTVGRSLCSTLGLIALIGLGNLVLANLLSGHAVTWRHVVQWQLMTLAVGVFPTLVGVLLTHVQLLRRYSSSAAVLSDRLATYADWDSGARPVPVEIELHGTNQGEVLRVAPHRVFCLAAADNYVTVHYADSTGKSQSRLLRSTLRRMEEALTGHGDFMRCHRTFIVNLACVERVSGNAQGLRLHLAGLDQPVPVSRGLTAEVQQRLQGL